MIQAGVSSSLIILNLLLILCSIGLPKLYAKEGKWNVILVTIDTLRADHLEPYRYSDVATPHISKLAENGVVFEHAVAPAPLTLPSHASILTGVEPMSHGIKENAGFVLAESHVTLAEILAEEGYRTGAFVGSFVLDATTGLNQGFDTYAADFRVREKELIAPGYVSKRAEEVAKGALSWINNLSISDRRFFCWIHFYDPHDPYTPPEPFATRYKAQPYDGEIAYVDSVIGQLLKALKELEIEKNTLIVLTSDHGESLGEHSEDTHGFFIYEATQHVPLIMVLPDGRFSGKRITGLVRLIDIAPTILHLLGIEVHSSIQGISLLQAVREGTNPRGVAYAESFYPRLQFGWSELRSIYHYPYKYIQAPQPELYHLADDPQEMVNLLKQEEDVAGSLRRMLSKILQHEPTNGHEGNQHQLSPEARTKLAELGYLTLPPSPTLKATDQSRLADPKEKIHSYNLMLEVFDQIRSGEFATALNSLQQILKDDPEAHFALHPLGVVYSHIGRNEEALAALKKATESFPDNSLLYFDLGGTFLKTQRWTEAAKAFQKAIELDYSNFRARHNLATLFRLAGRYRQSLRQSNIILQTIPDYEPALINKGLALSALGETDSAIKSLNSAVRINPSNPGTYAALAEIYTKKGDLEKANNYLEKVKELRETQP